MSRAEDNRSIVHERTPLRPTSAASRRSMASRPQSAASGASRCSHRRYESGGYSADSTIDGSIVAVDMYDLPDPAFNMPSPSPSLPRPGSASSSASSATADTTPTPAVSPEVRPPQSAWQQQAVRTLGQLYKVIVTRTVSLGPPPDSPEGAGSQRPSSAGSRPRSPAKSPRSRVSRGEDKVEVQKLVLDSLFVPDVGAVRALWEDFIQARREEQEPTSMGARPGSVTGQVGRRTPSRGASRLGMWQTSDTDNSVVLPRTEGWEGPWGDPSHWAAARPGAARPEAIADLSREFLQKLQRFVRAGSGGMFEAVSALGFVDNRAYTGTEIHSICHQVQLLVEEQLTAMVLSWTAVREHTEEWMQTNLVSTVQAAVNDFVRLVRHEHMDALTESGEIHDAEIEECKREHKQQQAALTEQHTATVRQLQTQQHALEVKAASLQKELQRVHGTRCGDGLGEYMYVLSW